MTRSMHYRLNRRAPGIAIRTVALAALFTILWYNSVQASGLSDRLPESLQIHGFASQGFIETSDNNFFGDSQDGGSFDYRELGLNASLRPLPNLQLSAQILSRTAGEGNDGDVRLDYGFADYSLVSNETNLFGLRLGRIKNPLGLYNDTRDVPFTRPTILLPQSIYFDRTRNLALSSDSIHIYGEHRANSANLSFQIGIGYPKVGDRETELAILGNDFPGRLEGDLSYLGRVIYERDGGRLRLALSVAQGNISYKPARAFPDDLLSGNNPFTPWILSAQYNAERWSLTAEYALRGLKYEDFGIPDLSFTGESYYLQGTYRFSSKWEGVLRYDVLYTDKDDRDGSQFAVATGQPAHNFFAKDWTVGLRWNITPSLMLRGEYHRVNGAAWLPLLDNPNPLESTQHWDLFAILASYRF